MRWVRKKSHTESASTPKPENPDTTRETFASAFGNLFVIKVIRMSAIGDGYKLE
jgi:hypothetical protein